MRDGVVVIQRLCASAAGHSILFDRNMVLRIWSISFAEDGAAACDGRRLPILDLPRLLGASGKAAARPLLAYGAALDDGDVLAIAVDALAGFISIDEDAMAPLPALSHEFGLLFDEIAVVPIAAGHPLCVRSALDCPALRAAGMLCGGED
ncbi:MAG: hypothetical protein ACREFQ_19790 [Stellaceae bacterium]